MKILKTDNNKEFNFNLLEKNIFVSSDLEFIFMISEILRGIVTGKIDTNKYIVKFEDNDINIDKKNFKHFKVPNFNEFSKDILSGNKSILKELIKLVLDADFFQYEELVLMLSTLENINFEKSKSIELLYSMILESTGLHLQVKLNNDLIDYIATNSMLSFENEEPINYIKIRKIYINILILLGKIDSKNILFEFINPFFGLDIEEEKEIIKLIMKLNYFYIVTDKFMSINDEILANVKIYSNNMIDYSKVIDEFEKYELYWDFNKKEEFIKHFRFEMLKLVFSNYHYLSSKRIDHYDYNYLDKNFASIIKNI